MEKVSFDEMAKIYCDRQLSTPAELLERLKAVKAKYNPKGFFMAECNQLDSALIGSLVVLPFGGAENTFKEIPTSPFSPRGSASDGSVAVMYCDTDLPEEAAPWEYPKIDKLTKEEKAEARHALGLPNKAKKSYRNQFCADEKNELWSRMVQRGLATMRPADTIPMGGSAMFYLTPMGAKLALNKGEKLSEYDFPELRPVPGFEGYRISDRGVVQSRKLTGWKTLRQDVDSRGRARVTLCQGSVPHRYLVSRLVLMAFVGPCPEGQEACHNDGDNRNDCLSNLRWDTHSANLLDRRRHGTAVRGEDINTAKLTEADVVAIRLAGYPLRPSAERYGISEAMVSAILRRKAWQHVA